MKARKEHYRNLMYSIGFCNSIKQLNEDHYNDFMKLFENHPDYPEKVKDVIDIKILPNAINPKHCELNLVRLDGSIDAISYIACCRLTHNKLTNIKQAMRHAISKQIFDFRNSTELVCVLCQSTDHIEIDHYNVPFRTLFSDFIKDRTLPDVFDDTFYNSPCFRQEDDAFRIEWEAYHKKNASLRPLCKKCNAKYR